jgi:hypothetical protein
VMDAAQPLLAWLFVNPVLLPDGARLWMLLPLVACVAVVYRATRVRTVADMPKATVYTFVNIVVGMGLIAVAFYAAHLLARQVL